MRTWQGYKFLNWLEWAETEVETLLVVLGKFVDAGGR
jgi:hypothetical protein